VGIVFTCVVLPIVLVVAYAWLQSATLSGTQQRNVDLVIAHAYPGSRMIRADGQISFWPAGNHVYVSVEVTFASSDPFDVIWAWYVRHPEGGRAGLDFKDFPKHGLDLLDESSEKTTYRVTYLDAADCYFALNGCERPAQRIR
jgi:hypothetical protein